MGAPTITNLLHNAGYSTGHIGKWNIGSNPPGSQASEYGITDVRITNSIPNDIRGREGLRFDEAIDFIEKNRNQSFYLNLWMHTPHTPISAPPEMINQFTNLSIDPNLFDMYMKEKFNTLSQNGTDISNIMRTYLADIYSMDIQVGNLVNKLDEYGLTDNTIVVFSSDNGPAPVEFGILGDAGGLRGGKHTWYEGGTRVPFIVKWPNHIPAGRIDDQSIMFGEDWVPSIASLANVDYNPDAFDGEDMSDVWLGTTTRSRTKPLFFRGLQNFEQIYIRYGRWKLHKNEKELYDLSVDPAETANVYDLYPDIVNELVKSLDSWELTMASDHVRLPDNPLPFDPTRLVEPILLPDIEGTFDSFAKPGHPATTTTVSPTTTTQQSTAPPVQQQQVSPAPTQESIVIVDIDPTIKPMEPVVSSGTRTNIVPTVAWIFVTTFACFTSMC